MPSTTTFSLKHTLPDHLESIYGILLDLRKFGEVHPHMTGVTVLHHHPEYVEYNIVEEIYVFGFIKNHPAYTAKVMEIEKHKHIRYTSPVKPFIFLTIDLTFSKSKKGTLLITETFEITCNTLMGIIFKDILKKAHLKAFENMRRIFKNSIEDIQLT